MSEKIDSSDPGWSSIIRSGLIKVFFFFSAVMLLVSCNEQQAADEDMMPAIRIRILNGCGFRNAASEYRDYLIRYNVDVIGLGNADKFIYNRTIIVVKKDDPQDLERLMKYTGITRRVYAVDSHSTESFQIILGKDFREYMNR